MKYPKAGDLQRETSTMLAGNPGEVRPGEPLNMIAGRYFARGQSRVPGALDMIRRSIGGDLEVIADSIEEDDGDRSRAFAAIKQMDLIQLPVFGNGLKAAGEMWDDHLRFAIHDGRIVKVIRAERYIGQASRFEMEEIRRVVNSDARGNWDLNAATLNVGRLGIVDFSKKNANTGGQGAPAKSYWYVELQKDPTRSVENGDFTLGYWLEWARLISEQTPARNPKRNPPEVELGMARQIYEAVSLEHWPPGVPHGTYSQFRSPPAWATKTADELYKAFEDVNDATMSELWAKADMYARRDRGPGIRRGLYQTDPAGFGADLVVTLIKVRRRHLLERGYISYGDYNDEAIDWESWMKFPLDFNIEKYWDGKVPKPGRGPARLRGNPCPNPWEVRSSIGLEGTYADRSEADTEAGNLRRAGAKNVQVKQRATTAAPPIRPSRPAGAPPQAHTPRGLPPGVPDPSGRRNPPEIEEGMSRAIWVTTFADRMYELSENSMEEYQQALVKLGATKRGVIDWDLVAPETPQWAHRAADELYRKFEEVNDASMAELVARAESADRQNAQRIRVNMYGLRDAEPETSEWHQARDTYDHMFGHYLAMQAMGHGVSWFDDHATFEIKFPRNFSVYKYDDGELHIPRKP